MLITHAHSDHMGDAVEICKKHKPKKVVANFEICTGWAGREWRTAPA